MIGIYLATLTMLIGDEPAQLAGLGRIRIAVEQPGRPMFDHPVVADITRVRTGNNAHALTGERRAQPGEHEEIHVARKLRQLIEANEVILRSGEILAHGVDVLDVTELDALIGVWEEPDMFAGVIAMLVAVEFQRAQDQRALEVRKRAPQQKRTPMVENGQCHQERALAAASGSAVEHLESRRVNYQLLLRQKLPMRQLIDGRVYAELLTQR